jgi:hypothetical protein
MNVLRKLELLTDIYSDPSELDQIIGKILDFILSQFKLKLAKYQQDMSKFEQQYGMSSALFHQRFEAGELGDETDFFEWEGLYELHQDILEKIHKLEQTV